MAGHWRALHSPAWPQGLPEGTRVTVPPDSSPPDRARQYWQKTLRLTRRLLVLWFFVTFGFGFFAGDLNFSLFGWPFSFWVAAQGALLVYCGIVWYYAVAMSRLDEAYGNLDGD